MSNTIKALCAMLRSFDNQPVPKDIKFIKGDFKYGLNEATEVMLVLKTESYIHQEINFNLVNKKP